MERWKQFVESTAGAILILFVGLLLFSAACVACAFKLPSNERIAVLFSGIVGNFSGALFTVITVHNRVNITGDNPVMNVKNTPPIEPPKDPEPEVKTESKSVI